MKMRLRESALLDVRAEEAVSRLLLFRIGGDGKQARPLFNDDQVRVLENDFHAAAPLPRRARARNFDHFPGFERMIKLRDGLTID